MMRMPNQQMLPIALRAQADLRRSKHRMKTLKKILIGLAVGSLLVVLGPILAVVVLPFVLVLNVKARISLRRFRHRENGNVYLVCTSHRQWFDFLQNNVIPFLPDNYRVMWVKSRRSNGSPEILEHLAQSKIFAVAKPYMIVVTPKALVHESLNAVLQGLKHQAKKTAAVQASCRQIIQDMESKLRTKPYAIGAKRASA